ncbi:gamma-glutamyltranspeptidase 1 [Artemisia annua]|uniref:Glutathione hydrolase n=1 Tax=Artemisia annua TaxID=35608 RepID=A0A2U1PZ51_ARTAN|nr:gamma-glutamyltranspeptidase 1 [Artemisia annua]
MVGLKVSVIYLTIGSKLSELALSGWKGLIKSIQVDDALKSHKVQPSDAVESFEAVVAADDARCSEIGASVLRAGGHAVDAAVLVALCGGVVNPMASGIGGGGFMVVRSADTLQAQAFDCRETAPSAASQGGPKLSFSVIYLTIGSKLSELALSGWKGLIKSIQVDDALKSHKVQPSDAVESFEAVVAADDARCSEIGASVLRAGGHAVDAAVLVALCGGVVNPMASGIGGGGFMVVRSADTLQAQAFDCRETAPSAASQTLFQPAISLAKDGFIVAPYLANSLSTYADGIKKDPGLKRVYAPNGEVLQAGETCYNYELGLSLEAIAEEGPEAFYNGTIGEKLIKDVRSAGGILTMEDLRNYEVKVTDAVEVNTMGFKIFGMPPPSSGTLGLALVLNILNSYENTNDANGPIGLHRFLEALKHMFALRMNLGDPDFVDISKTASEMLSPSFAKKIQQRIFDNTTFPSEYYMPGWSQIEDHGTSHFCIVDADRNAVSMTTTVNYPFGGGILSPLTGIVLNNEMGDFSAPTEISPDSLPPSPTNFISPNKRPLSSMTPVIIVKGDQLVGVIGGSGGMYIIPAVIQVFLNHFILGMEPLYAVQSPRVYHKLIPNVVYYENWTVIDGDHIELSDDQKKFLIERGHVLQSKSGGAVSQLIVQTLKKPIENRRVSYNHKQVLKGMLTAISDPRKDGRPAVC